MRTNRLSLVLYALLGLIAGPLSGQEQKFANLGTCPLVNGAAIQDCRLGYRTLGTLSADKSNAILVPSWASGTSEQAMAGFATPGFAMLDKAKYFLIFVDSFANGISSSPSNSKKQPRMSFPKITILDMVNASHALVTKELGISHLYAVAGLSMGGMQAFQWIVSYPDFMDRAVSMVGSPRLGSYDLIMWQAHIDMIKRSAAWEGGNYKVNPMGALEAEFSLLTLQTPGAVDRQIERAKVSDAIKAGEASNQIDANDTIRQAEAMMALDVSQPFGGSMEEAAKKVKAKVLIIVDRYDHTVTPGPAIAFAQLIHVEPMVFDSDCGHVFIGCEMKNVAPKVVEFLR